MKVINIGTHRVKHMWLAYVKKLLVDNPDYQKRDRGDDSKSRAQYHNIVVERISRGRWIQVIDYNRFRKIVEHLFDKAKTAVIAGEAFNLPQCGKIYVTRIQRDFRSKNRPVDWGRTMKVNQDFDENGKRIFKKMIRHNADDYLRVAWVRARIPNQTWYEFVPAHGDRARQAGFKLELAMANKKDPFLKFQYLFCPLRDIVKQEIV